MSDEALGLIVCTCAVSCAILYAETERTVFLWLVFAVFFPFLIFGHLLLRCAR